MKTSVHITLAGAIAIGGIVGAVSVVKRRAVTPPARTQVVRAEPQVAPAPARTENPAVQPQQDPPLATVEPSPTTRPAEVAAPQPAPSETVKPPRAIKAAPNTTAGIAPAPAAAPPKSKPPLTAPVARVALSFVGADADAEAVWLDAINDPTVPPNERKDLIEDLNEDGFPDPKNITPDDVPLVLSRIQLIESIAADSMDETNLAAFAEAYKDLVNMLDRATRQ
jgi:hypothetical protein